MRQLLIIIGTAIFLWGCEKDTSLESNEKKTNLIKIITYSSFDKTNVSGMMAFDYDDENNLIKETYYPGESIYPLIYSIFEYVNNKKKVELIYTSAGSSESGTPLFNLSRKVTFFYDGDKLIREEPSLPYTGEVWNYTEYKYDERGNLIRESRIQVAPYFNWTTEYFYDSNNFKTKTVRFDDKYLNIIGYTEHYYSSGLLSNEKDYNSQKVLCSEFDYTYNSEGKLIEKTETQNGETKVLESISYSDSFISERIIYDWDYRWGYRFLGVEVYVYE
ncbi:MAG: hypothetical protein LBI82_02165 [Dysgonamonadaceae bacterium]|jgi:hypothetical protein|nr:hypothetical protein [Dysgonamonadaceae bacterium]